MHVNLTDHRLAIDLSAHEGIQAQIEEILRWRNMSVGEFLSSLHSTTTPTNHGGGYIEYEEETVKWRLIVPTIVLVLFLLGVAACLYGHNWREKRRNRGQLGSINMTRFSRNLVQGRADTNHDWRGSTRSTTPLRASVADKVHVVPLNRTTAESYPFNNDGDWKYLSFSRKLSPIDEVNVTKERTKSDSMLSVQPSFSPYHLTWISPHARNAMSEGSLPPRNTFTPSDGSYKPRGHNVITKPFPSSFVRNTPAARILKEDNGAASIKKSFSPQPSVQEEIASTDMLMNDQLYDIEMTASDYSVPPPCQKPPRRQPIIPRLPAGTQIEANGPRSSTFNMQPTPAPTPTGQANCSDASGQWSLPSSISHWHQDRINSVGPPLIISHKDGDMNYFSNIDLSDHYSDNTSLYPNIGSSITSGHPTIISNELSSVHSGITETDDTTKSRIEAYDNPCFNFGSDINIQNSHQSSVSDVPVPHNSYVAEIHRSWSMSGELEPSPQLTPPNTTPSFGTTDGSYVCGVIIGQQPGTHFSRSDPNLASFCAQGSLRRNNLNKVTSERRKVTFDNIPVLAAKQYWL